MQKMLKMIDKQAYASEVKNFPERPDLNIYFFRSGFTRRLSHWKIVFQDYYDWRNYVQDRQFKKDCQTAVTAVWDLSSEEVNHFMKNMFWLLL